MQKSCKVEKEDKKNWFCKKGLNYYWGQHFQVPTMNVNAYFGAHIQGMSRDCEENSCILKLFLDMDTNSSRFSEQKQKMCKTFKDSQRIPFTLAIITNFPGNLKDGFNLIMYVRKGTYQFYFLNLQKLLYNFGIFNVNGKISISWWKMIVCLKLFLIS